MLNIEKLKKEVKAGYKINKEEALELYNYENIEELFESAREIMVYFLGNKFELCSIMNAKSGKCSENCTYCAQSKHYNTGILEYPLVGKEDALKQAKYNEENGVHRFSLVTSGRMASKKEIEELGVIFKELKKKSNIKLCSSNGILSYEKLIKLKEAGVIRYHHNLETSREYYDKICTTHSFQDRVNTIKAAKKAGLEVCSGGILGLGESREDRISMAMELRELQVDSIPINILTQIKGTPLENQEPLEKEEILRTIAVFRFINPKTFIRYAGGRGKLGVLAEKGLEAGINSALTGKFLTTIGSNSIQDIAMFKRKDFDAMSYNE